MISKDALPLKSLHQPSSHGQSDKFRDCSCNDLGPTTYECQMCKKSDMEVYYQYCESCLMCQGTFVPWGVDVTLKFVGDQVSVTQISARTYFDRNMLCIFTNGLVANPSKYIKESELETDDDDDDDDRREKKMVAIEEAIKRPVKKAKDKDSSSSGGDSKSQELEESKEEKSANTKSEVITKQEPETDGSDQGEEMTAESSEAEEDDESTSSSHRLRLSPKKSEAPDAEMKLYQPILKIQGSRQIRNAPSKRKTPKHHKTLSDEFESILSRPSLGKRRIKPTEKVKWLTEQYVARKNESQTSPTNKSKMKESKTKPDKDVKTSSPNPKSGDRVKDGASAEKDAEDESSSEEPKEKPPEKDQEASDGEPNAGGSPRKEGSEKEGEEASYQEEEEELHNSDADPEYLLEEVLIEEEEEGSIDSDIEDVVRAVVKTEIVENDEITEESPEVNDKNEDARLAQAKKLYGSFVPRKRGRPPGRRRKRRAYSKLIDDEKMVVKMEDGKEIDLNKVRIKNLQEDDQMYKCPICGKEYKSQGGMQYHLATHTSSARYHCSLCSYSTIRHGDLKKHYVIHTGIKPFRCETCQQEFSTSSSYKRHLRIHSGEKPYKCEVCGKAFRNITTRKQHLTLHTGIKNFVCEVCGKSFALKHHYTSHSKRHTGIMPFKCIYCDGTFKTHNALKTHRKKEHPVEEAERIQQNRLRRKSAVKEEKIKMEDDMIPDHQVLQAPGDVLEQAMAATVETVDGVHYEYVDVTDPSIPLVSKMIKENWNGRDSVVLTITHIEEDEFNEVDDD